MAIENESNDAFISLSYDLHQVEKLRKMVIINF